MTFGRKRSVIFSVMLATTLADCWVHCALSRPLSSMRYSAVRCRCCHSDKEVIMTTQDSAEREPIDWFAWSCGAGGALLIAVISYLFGTN